MGLTELYNLHDKIKFGKRKYLGSTYYDYPDGEDLLGKLAFTTKWSGLVGTFFGVLYAARAPIPPNIVGKLRRVMVFTLPATGMAATFTCVTYYATIVRKKDDELNYILGGLAAGSLLGPIGGPSMGFWSAFYFAVTGAVKKYHQLRGEKLVQTSKYKNLSTYYMRQFDTSKVAERKGNWTKEPPAN